ncbi:endo-alpha-N-acetylgalactosaminidase family protein [Arthrobacter tecti]
MSSSSQRLRRAGSLSVIGVVAASALTPLAALPAAAQEAGNTQIIASGELAVTVSSEFPQVVSYEHLATDAVLGGNADTLEAVTINGQAQPADVVVQEDGDAAVNYTLTFPGIEGAELDARISVEESVVTFEVTGITDGSDTEIRTIQIPGHELVSVSSAQSGSQVSTANISVDRAVSGDTFTPVTDATPIDAQPKGSAFAIANTSELAAALESNSLYDTSSGPGFRDQGRFWRQAEQDGENVRMGISSGQWLYRANESTETEELPWTRIAITPDANDDGAVDWQDGAIALRNNIAVMPFKGEQVPDKVVHRIPFNFASQATHPFLRTLDDTKRIALATDGLGQSALLKGFGSEGHDSANTDFADNYNTRAGGLEDLNKLLEEGEKWNASFGVHINQTEAYPESLFFDTGMFDPNAKGWNWLDQSYYIDQRQDILSGYLAERMGKFRDQTHENLDWVYVDVFYQFGWLADRMQDELIKNGFRVSSEWSDKLFRNNTWAHWATDENYGGSTNKGVNSNIIRFVQNSHKDTWNPHPLLGNANIVEWEGWTGENNYEAFYENIWVKNLPAKFLQQEKILKWEQNRIDLTGNLSVSGTSAEDRIITVGGAEVLRGDTYLLPWASDGDESKQQKLYHYNPAGGTTTWKLPDTFRQSGAYKLFKLTDNGRVEVAAPKVTKGEVTIEAEAGQPYVLVHDKRPVLPRNAEFGEGTPIQDPGFNAANLDAWSPQGSVEIERNDLGHRYAVLGAGASSISQKLGKLDAGTYSVSAWVEIEPGKERETTLSIEGGVEPATETVSSSGAENFIAADEKHGTHFQRLRVLIDVPERGAAPKLTIQAADGEAPVRVDDIRVNKTERVPTEGVLAEDFENVDQGWGPFVKGNAGGANDPRTHLSELNAPYTQKGWNGKAVDDAIDGKWSLKAHEENRGPGGGPGLVYRTSNYTVPMTPGHEYRVSFDYQNALADQYNWVGGYDGTNGVVQTQSQALPQALETTRFEHTIVAGGCGEAWVGLERSGGSGGADFILDNLLVEDLGPAEAIPACAQLSVDMVPDVVTQNAENEFTTTFTSDEPAVINDVAVNLDLPEGWTAEAETPNTAATLAPGASLTTKWQVTAPASADGNYTIGSDATYTTTSEPVGERTARGEVSVYTLPQAPTETVFASDHQWVSASNGWGPVERDLSNGDQGTGDGTPLTLNGTAYEKGLGAHAASDIEYFVGGQCTRFTADVGVDDAQPTRGTIQFEVWADGRRLTQTPVMRPDSQTIELDVDLTGARYVNLIVGNAGDGVGNDHGDWADAQFHCG